MQIEFKIHCAIFEHHKTAFSWVKFVFVPNASKDATTGYFNKLMGLCPGAHDIHLYWDRFFLGDKPGNINVGIFEVKSPSGKLTSNQNQYASEMAYLGAKTGWGCSVKSYHDTLSRWGLKPIHNGIKEPDLRSFNQKKQDAYDFFAPR